MVVSLLSHSTSVHIQLHSLFCHPHNRPPSHFKQLYHPLRRRNLALHSCDSSNAPSTSNSQLEPPQILSPGGYTRLDNKAPNLALELNADDILDDKFVRDVIGDAVSGVADIVPPLMPVAALFVIKELKSIIQKAAVDCLQIPNKISLAMQIGALLTTVAQPALAVTGVNDEEDLTVILVQSAIAAFFYFLVAPPIIMNWLRIRWYRRGLLEMYFQFMFVFIFFPGVLLWAPFLNFRKFPRDPSMEYPWSTPEDPSKICNSYRKFPWATPEDYDYD